MELVDPDGMFGDFSSMSFMDAAVHESLEIDWSQQGGMTASETEAAWAEYGLDYVATGLVRANEGTLSHDMGLSGVGTPSGSGSDWYGYWQIYRNPKDNTHQTSPPAFVLSGNYGLNSIWILNVTSPLPG